MKFRPRLAALIVFAFVLVACTPEPGDVAEPADTAQPNPETASVAAGNRPPVSVPEPEPEPVVVEPTIISSGTVMEVMLIDSISTEANTSGDVFLASLSAPIVVDGSTVVEEGATVRGLIVELQEPGRVSGRARIEMVLTEIVGASVNIPISTSRLVEESDPQTGRDATVGAAGGAIGALVGGLTGGKKGAIIGGAAGAVGTVLGTKGDQLEYPAETRLSFTLSQDVEISGGQTIS